MRSGQKLNLRHAAEEVVAVPLAYASAGRSLAWAALAGARQFEQLRHHPRHDVVDRLHGTRFYYHAHDVEHRGSAEHGHFHLFAEGERWGGFVHLAALSLDSQGLPLQWFATNGWVTGESRRPASVVRQALDVFEVQTPGRLAPVARWLAAMVSLFRSELESLAEARDTAVQRLSEGASADEVWSNRQYEVLASCSALLPARLAQLGLA